jgi:DNA-binding transcriptional regulator YiaG
MQTISKNLALNRLKMAVREEKRKMDDLVDKSREPEYYTLNELALKLNLAKKTIKKWTQARRLPGQVKCGGRWRYRCIDVEKALLRGELLDK